MGFSAPRDGEPARHAPTIDAGSDAVAIYRLLVESWSKEHIAFCRELLGFQLSAPSTEALEERAPAAILKHLDWLRAGGQALPAEAVRALIVERVERDPRGIMPHFAADVRPMTRAELGIAQRVDERSQQELFEIYRRHGPDRAVATQAFGDLTLGALLVQVAELDNWYLTCLTGVSGIALPADPPQAIVSADRHFRTQALRLSDAFHDVVEIADGEAWTFAKMIRRRTGHFREHFPEFERQP